MIDLRFVHIPRPVTKGVGIKSGQFRSKYLDTLNMLESELGKLGAKQITIQAGFTRDKIRNDGWPYGTAKPEHPACVLQFTDRKGQALAFRAFKYTEYEDNLRAIAMTLEALRAVDRYGVVEGEQYTGFKQLGAAPEVVTGMTRQNAAAFLARLVGMQQAYIYSAPADVLSDLYRMAAKKVHPDLNPGREEEDFKSLQIAMRALQEKVG